LESLGVEKSAIRRRVAEMAAFFDMEGWFELETASLSGGQKQLLNLASVMVLQPRLLLLDEPTAQLDPIAATEFLHAVDRIRRELGTTVILSEHRLEEALPLSDRVLALNRELLCLGTVREVSEALRGTSLYACMPTPMRLCGASDVSEARQWFQNRKEPLLPLPPRPVRESSGTAVELRHVAYRHERKGKDLLRDLHCAFGKGQLTAILGGNGAGKSTTLSLIAGLKHPRQGSVRLHGRIALLPQDPQALFLRDSLREDLADLSADYAAVAELCKLKTLLDRHPYDLSGGEQQRAALAKILLAEPEILLLDEPTAALDLACKQRIADYLRHYKDNGGLLLLTTHDVMELSLCDAWYIIRDGVLEPFTFDGNVQKLVESL
jgi:energy-coupling factor transport system ATP-binding protein